MKKHYDSNYLNKTFNLAKQIKLDSYGFFQNINEGTLLDLGCGTGQDILEIGKNSNLTLVGIDHDETMINIANKNSKSEKIRFEVGDAEKINFNDNSISGIRAERMFQHLNNQKKVLNEIYRCLKLDGILVVVETDWLSLTIYNTHHQLVRKIQNYLAEKKVNNGFSCRSLFSDLPSLNFKLLDALIYPIVIRTLKEANDYFMIEKIVEEMTSIKLLTMNEKTTILNSFYELDKAGLFNLTINSLIFHAIKK